MTMAPRSEAERLATLESEMGDVRRDVKDIKTDIHMMRGELAGRPSWAVTAVITMLTSAVGVLTTLLAVVS